MANQLKMAIIQAIQTLRAQGWSFRRIARELGIHRETVANHVRRGPVDSIPAQAPSGAAASDLDPTGWECAPKPAQAPPGSWPSRSGCEPWREAIVAKLAAGLSGQRIFQDLTLETDFRGSYYSVRRFLRQLGAATPLPFRRMESAPGQEAQGDFGTGAAIVGSDGKRRRTHVFRIVLSHSRKAYSEVTYRQTTEDFLGALENAFRHFGGVPRTLVIDNLKAAVKHPDWYDPELVPRVAAFAAHYGVVILPTKPYTPRHKGKVERGVDYVQENALKGRKFASLEEQNRHLADWEASVADTRVHGTTKRHVRSVFEQSDRLALGPLPSERFPCFREAERSVNRDGHVEVAKAYYSVPPEYVGRRVWVRWDARLVRILNHRLEQIALHLRHEPGRFSTQGAHLPAERIGGVERGVAHLMGKVQRIGPETRRWAEAMLRERGIEGVRVLQGLLSLANRHAAEALENACRTASTHGAYRLRTLRQLLRRGGEGLRQLAFLEEHPLIRPLADYGRFVAAALRGDRLGASPPDPQDLGRQGRANERGQEQQSPGGGSRQGSRDVHPPCPGYPSSDHAAHGARSPALPDSVSPDIATIARDPSPPVELRYA